MILLVSGEGVTSFSVNNRTNFFGEKKKIKKAFRCFFSFFCFFENTRKLNCKLNLVLVLKSKALYTLPLDNNFLDNKVWAIFGG